jgi:predicted nicotinamide N-methyase
MVTQRLCNRLRVRPQVAGRELAIVKTAWRLGICCQAVFDIEQREAIYILNGLFLGKYALCIHDVDMPGRQLHISSISGVDRLVEQAENEDQLPFWADLWPSAVGLASYLWSKDLQDASVLELGAGPGLPGLAAALRGARVLQTDFIPDALELARHNAACNKVTGMEWALADWRDFSIDGRFTWVIGSDIAYEPSVHEHLFQVVSRSIAVNGCFVLADPGRAPALKLVDLFVTAGWRWEIGEITVPWEGR